MVGRLRYVQGGTVSGELVYYPSQVPLRGLLKEPVETKNTFSIPSISQGIEQLSDAFSQKLAADPFADALPFILSDIRVYLEKDRWFVIDGDSRILELVNPDDECWMILTISRCKSFSGFGIYENEAFKLLALWQDDLYYSLC